LGFKIRPVNEDKSSKKSLRPRKAHSERCPECKREIEEMLEKLYGEAKKDYKIMIGSQLDDYKDSHLYNELKKFSQLYRTIEAMRIL
jgi:PP-loop superfamily ATP-utilizing enzyme